MESTDKQPVSQFIKEFNFRKQYSYGLRYIKINRLKGLKHAKMVMFN